LRPNAWVGLAAVIFGAIYTQQAWVLPRAPIGNPIAPILFPLGIGIFMMLMGAVLFIQEAMKGLNADDKSKRPQFHWKGLKLIVFVVVMCAIYTVMFDYAGFVFSTLIFLGSMLTVINPGKLKLNAIVTCCFAFGLWYVFGSLLQINLPTSPLGMI
jgi:putative tricarboxylic transport membrane protein